MTRNDLPVQAVMFFRLGNAGDTDEGIGSPHVAYLVPNATFSLLFVPIQLFAKIIQGFEIRPWPGTGSTHNI